MRTTLAAGKIQFTLLAILVFAFAWLTFYHLGRKPLIDFDEAIYAQVASEALQNHTPLGFTWIGNIALHRTEMWFEKPPVMIWLTEASYLVFGVNEFAARFWSAVFAVLTLPLVFCFVRKLTQSPAAPILSAAAFFIAFQFDDSAGVLQLDIPVGFCVLLAMYSFWCARENDRFYLLFWAALGFGVMIKSVIGLLPLPIILLWSVLANEFKYFKNANLWRGALVFLAIVVPWHVIEHVRYGKSFWEQYLFYHVLERYSRTLEGNGGSSFFYFDILCRQKILFWCLAGSLTYFLVRAIRSKGHLLVVTAFLFIFLFFSAAGTKLPPYILVIYPFAAALVGTTLGDFARLLERIKKYFGTCFAVTAVLIFGAAGVKNFQTRLERENDPELVSDKAVGEFLRDNVPDQHVYYFSVRQVRPAVMFYSGRVVFNYDFYRLPKPEAKFIAISGVPLHYPMQTNLFSTATEAVYQIQ